MKQKIAYKDLPLEEIGFSKLFSHYVTDYSLVASFFNGDYRDTTVWQSHCTSVAERTIDRSKLVQILLNQNRSFQCNVHTLSNIDQLINDTTFAVVTGQQVGICTGPLYTLYKILTSVKLTKSLNQQFPEYHFVPVFWLESEDHDYSEASQISLLTKTNELKTFSYEIPNKQILKNVTPVGSIEFDETVHLFFNELQDSLLHTEFTPKVFELFRSAYSPGMTFTRAFVHILNVLLDDAGVIFINPADPLLKQLLKPVFYKELTHVSRTSQLVITQSDALEVHYHAQVKPRAVNLFLNHNNGRYAIEPKENGFFLRGTRQHFTHEHLLSLLDTSPELFSPNVVLRPICQDYILPTIAYVAGPSEIAYFAQFKLVYEDFALPMPLLYPRASITILEERPHDILKKYNLTILDAFQEKEFLQKKIVDRLSDFKIDPLFANTAGTIEESLITLKDGLEKIDPTLVPVLENALKKIHAHLNVLKEKTQAAQVRQYEVALRQIDRAITSIFPASTLQERVLNVLYFLNKYGLEFVRWLNEEMDLDTQHHQIIGI